MKILLSSLLSAVVILAVPAIAKGQAAPRVPVPSAPAQPAMKTVKPSSDQQLGIIKLQRDATTAYAREQERRQQAQIDEQEAQKKAQDTLSALTAQLSAEIAKTRKDLKLADDAVFNADSVTFSVQEKK